MKLGYCLMAAVALSAGGAARAAGELDAFLVAIDRADTIAAQKLYTERLEKMTAARPARDPVLDRMAGELTLRGGSAQMALAFLDRARIGAAPDDAAAIMLGVGRAHESYGDLDAAALAYRAAAARPPASATGRDARNGLARILLARAPQEAAALAATVIAAATTAEERWEAELTASRAAAIAGRPAEAAKVLAAAWADAPAAKLEDKAAIRIAQDMAQDAFQAGDRSRGVALTSLARSGNGIARGAQVPPCGVGGVQPDDRVVVEIAASRFGRRYSAVRASRPAIARPFLDALANGEQALEDFMPLFVTLRCSQAASVLPPRLAPNPLAAWFASNALYPIFPDAADGIDAAIVELERIVREREKLGAAGAPLLVQPLLTLAGLYSFQASVSANPGYLARAGEAFQRAMPIALAAGAPPAAIRSLQERIAMQKEIEAARGAQVTPMMIKQFDAMEAAPGTDTVIIAQWAMAVMQADAETIPPDTRVAVGERALAALRRRGADPAGAESRTLSTALIAELRKIDSADRIAALAKAARLEADSCARLAHPPGLDIDSQRSIGPDQYPKDALIASLEGMTRIELNVDAAGRAAAPRVVVGYPPELFDDVTLAAARAFRFEPPGGSGRVAACRGLTQRVRWQVPQGFDPRMLQGDLGEPGS